MCVNNHVKEDMQKRDPDWWQPEDEKYWSLQKESVKQREQIERRIAQWVDLIVDVGGGGQGRMLSLAPRTDAMVLLDISEKMIERSKYNAERKGIDNSYFIVGDAENVPLRESSADVVICLQTLIHIPNRKRSIRELSRIMKKDGTLIVDIPLHNLIDFVYWSLRHGGVKNLVVDIMKKIGVLKSYSAPMKRKAFYDVCKDLNLSIADQFKVGPWNTFFLKKEVNK